MHFQCNVLFQLKEKSNKVVIQKDQIVRTQNIKDFSPHPPPLLVCISYRKIVHFNMGRTHLVAPRMRMYYLNAPKFQTSKIYKKIFINFEVTKIHGNKTKRKTDDSRKHVFQ